MTNKEFLLWIHERLVQFHGEGENMDYMRKLRAVIQSVEDTEKDLYSLKKDYNQLRSLILEISTYGQANIECTDRTSPTGRLILELCK